MRIRQRLRIQALLTMSVVAVVGFFLYIMDDIRNDRIKDALIIEDINLSVFEIHALTSDYMIRPDEWTIRRWRSEHEKLNGLLGELRVEDISEQAALDVIASGISHIASLFKGLIEDTGKPGENPDPAYRELVVSQLRTQTQSMITAGHQLSRIHRSHITGALQAGEAAILAAVFLLVFVAVGLVLLGRSIVRSIETLRKGTRIIASGGLDHRVGIDRPDELGELAQDFNQMTESLKDSRKALKESEERLRFVLESSCTGAWDLDLTDHTAYRSLEHDRIFGYPVQLPQWTLSDFLEHALPEYQDPVVAMVRDATIARTGWTYECRIRRADGEIRWIWFTGRHYTDSSGHDRVAGIVQDITGRKRVEEALQGSLEEKDVLLRELSHRTKNNMQVIIGLLSLQASKSKDDNLAQALAEAQDRIRIMALVYEKLHRSGSVSSLRMKDYIEDLVASLLNAHKGTHGPVQPVLKLEDVEISHDAALPCGLILNELVSNSLKHAFPDGKTGNIFISLRRLGRKVELRYKDDGPGLPGGLVLSKVETLGLKLVYNLAVRQLRGTMELARDPGTEFVFRFPLPTIV